MTKMTTPEPHRKHHLCCGLAHLALAGIALLNNATAVALAELAIAVTYLDMAWRGRA